MAEQGLSIRIRLKAYDHKVIDQSAKQIVDTAIRTGATVGTSASTNTTKHFHSCKKPTRL